MTATLAPRSQRTKTPIVLQHEIVECGAASLTMVLHYYKCYIPLDQVRIDCGVSRDGSNAANIVKAANSYGLNSKGFRNEIESLKKHRLPIIVFWQFYHFLVVEGYDERFFYLNDPALGRRRLTYDEFSEGFTGIVLTFEPGPDFKPQGKPPDLWEEIKLRLKEDREPVTFALLTSLLMLGPILVLPALSKIFVDFFLIKKLSTSVNLVLATIAVVFFVQLCLIHLQQRYLLRLRTKISLKGGLGYMQHLIGLPMKFFSQRFEGSLVQQMLGNEKVANLLFGQSALGLLQIFNALIIAIAMFFYDIRLAFLTITLTLMNITLVYFILAWRADAGLKLMMDEYKITAATYGALQSVETFKATGTDSDFFTRWAGLQAKTATGRQKLSYLRVAQEIAPNMLFGLTTVAILWSGSDSIIDGKITIGTLVAFQVLALSFIQPVQHWVKSVAQLQEAQGLLAQMSDTLKYPLDPRTEIVESSAEPHKGLSGYIELKDIEFGYAQLSPPLIEKFNMSLRPGSRVAIVGASGSGKSTTTKLISGLYKPWSGQILFDGESIDTISTNRLSESLAVVSQEVFLFDGTVRENLTLRDPVQTEANVIQATKDAEIHDEIAMRRGGYDCYVRAGGSNFSGGQAQRLEIARALVSNPSIIILDEATSSLDPVVEERIYRNLRRRGVTTIIVAHRLSAIRDCDEIIVLDQGKIMQRGTHATLIATPGPYKEMVNANQ
ncbi:MAG: NHLP family bacteriocin export ABC transporter peptidase/permease/ATPase subunit [Candidatus Obscuribacterales bacterium]|nr:NHLP family bacteriocin export ABC transporter peptidase/permease/ATPase subunit [Candidatus Obscuribacterales bacterium]